MVACEICSAFFNARNAARKSSSTNRRSPQEKFTSFLERELLVVLVFNFSAGIRR